MGELEVALGEVLAGGAAERVLDRFLRRHRAFTAEERTVAAEAIFGVGLWRRRLAFHGSTEPRLLLLSLLRDVAELPEAQGLQAVGLEHAPPRRPPPETIADFFSLPDWLAGALTVELGSEVEAFCDAIARPGPICLRANALKTSRAELLSELAREGVPATPGRFGRDAVLLEGRANLLGLAASREGRFEAQDEGSQLLAELVEAQPGERVLDLCAGAGGKTLALAAQLQNRGELYAYDVDGERLDRLLQRASRAGVNCVRVLRPTAFPDELVVDRVLVDAPCSELGALRRGPDLRFRIDPSAFPALERTQAELLERAARCVRPGGRLVYATCTLRRQENEDAAHAFEQRHPEFRRVTVASHAALFTHGFFRVLPHRHGTDGFFAAVYERT